MRTKVFISYSHKDKEWLDRLHVHLQPLMRDQNIDIWDDTRIAPGAKWHDEIQKALEAAKVAVLLISADFLASDFIAKEELPALLQAAEENGAVILGVILSPSRFARTPLAQFQTLNPPEKSLVNLAKGEQELILVKLSEAIESTLEKVAVDEPEPKKALAVEQNAVAKTGTGTKIWFSDFLHPDPVSIKLAVQDFEKGQRNFTIEWPEDNRRSLETVVDLFDQARNYRNKDSAFYGCDPQAVLGFIHFAKKYSVQKYQEETCHVEKRVPTLLESMVNQCSYYFDYMIEKSLANYLAFANFNIHSELAYALRHQALFEKFYPKEWDVLHREATTRGNKELNILFDVDEPFYYARLERISGVAVRECCPGIGSSGYIYIRGPKSMLVDAGYDEYLREFRPDEFGNYHYGFLRNTVADLVYKYLVPQIEWELAQHSLENVVKYDGDAGIKVIKGRVAGEELVVEMEWLYRYDRNEYYHRRATGFGYGLAEDDELTWEEVQEQRWLWDTDKAE